MMLRSQRGLQDNSTSIGKPIGKGILLILVLGGMTLCALVAQLSSIRPLTMMKGDTRDEIDSLRLKVSQLEQELDKFRKELQVDDEASVTGHDKRKERNVLVNSMCRCSSNNLPIPGDNHNFSTIVPIDIQQQASLATGPYDKRYQMKRQTCKCQQGEGSPTLDQYLKNMEQQFCGSPKGTKYSWDTMPDFGVEQKLPVFLGVLSYESPLSLEATLRQWNTAGFTEENVGLAGSFIQLNHKSGRDQHVIEENKGFNFTVFGDEKENIHPGKTIARFCRAAEKSPHGHPNGENLIMFLEKDWHLDGNGEDLKRLINAINSLTQRGINYVRMTPSLSSQSTWVCDAEGIKFECLPAHQQRYTNLPAVMRCDWFLRYLEPFALIDDPIMHGCRNNFRKRKYFDWEEAMQDGRIAWTESHWVVANYNGRPGWFHSEVDQ